MSEAVEQSFNCISVEGHTSTNDTVLLLANGLATGANPFRAKNLSTLVNWSGSRASTSARMIPDDGEGATHRVIIDVEGCRDREEARTIARAVADSPLVKTAIHGADPNWGRISRRPVMPAFRSRNPTSRFSSTVWNSIATGRLGIRLRALSTGLRAERDVHVRLVFRLGTASVRFWTSDLTAEYVRLNADYTT